MNEIRKSALVAHSAERIFDLIEAAENYPAFLPWCSAATILMRDDAVVSALITIDYRGVRLDFTTRNPKRRPEFMAIHLERGPFRQFQGEWHLKPLGTDGCRIDFCLRYEFASTAMTRLAGPVFDRIANTLVDAFVTRADRVYRTQPPTNA
jgi:ribosome-associated toxin RatA of RatAB toxin-antitoxin module